MQPSRSQLRYASQRIVSHLYEQKDWQRLFDLLETKPFLADQAEQLAGFQASGDDLETYVLAAAMEAGDWRRFLHYASVALNLRGVAEDLAAPEILRALARTGRAGLALDAAGRLPDPFRQAQALASIAAASLDISTRDDVLRELENRLDDLAREADGKSDHAEALAGIAREAGPALHTRWAEWIGRLASGRAAEVWRAVAERWLDKGDLREEGLWQTLHAIGDPAQVLALAPARLGARDLEDPAKILRRLDGLLPDRPDRQLAGATLLGELARRDPEKACSAWDGWSARSPLVWSAELIDRGREIFGHWAPQRIEEVAASIMASSARAALRVVVLETRRTPEAAAAALAELQSLPDGSGKLHWSLRYLTARSQEPQDEVRRQVIAVSRYLHEIRFSANAHDLARWLDLVALHLPDRIGSQLDAVLWSPELTPKKVSALADALTCPETLDLLIDRAERTAAALSPSEAEGFVLRKDLLIRATCRRSVLTQSLEILKTVAERLLPEEEDELREALAPQLAALSGSGSKLAEEVCTGIGDSRRRLITILRSDPSISPEALAPASLYAEFANLEILEDECHGLVALLETPADPRELLQRLVLPIRNPLLRTRALLRLAGHTLAFEISCHDQPDLLTPLELVRWMITTETDEELASLTPEIAALGAGAGGKRAATEVQEAARQLAALEEVDWPIRRESLEDLLARIARGLLPTQKAAAAVLATMLRLPTQLRPETARQALRQHWLDILPLIVAAADRLPERHLQPIRSALRESLNDFSRDGALPRIFELCLATPAEREKAADSIDTAGGSELQALAYLLTRQSPHRVPEVVGRLSAPESAGLAMRLIRHGWLPKEAARALLPHIAGGGGEAEIWCGPEKGREAAWIERAAFWIGTEAPSPSDPHIEPLLSRLWAAPEVSRLALAREIQGALRRGRPQGEAALRIWLHAHLAPNLGRGRPQGVADASIAEEALGLAKRLAPEGSPPMSPEAGLRNLRLEPIEKRWPVSAWDYHRLSRWISFDESYGTSVLALGLFLASSYLDALLLWPQDSSPLLGIDKLGESPPGRALLVVLLLLNAWIFDRLLAARIPANRKERTWLRLTRLVAAAIPLAGLGIFLLWQRLLPSAPAWAFLPRREASLRLHGTLPENLGPVQLRSGTDLRLKTWSQRRMAQIPWLIACQITPLFSGLHLISQHRGLALAVCLSLHLAGACAALAHVRLRIPRLQMTSGRSLAFRLLPLALLLPVPFSIAVALLWLPASEESKENNGVLETLYRR
ncbi:MAG TPA: hypothetical protein VLQ45_22280, partial [Thermoanaerobaculia bacterium]|nr:hypothetical protein [Thermoanaerobaculia bacterium]